MIDATQTQFLSSVDVESPHNIQTWQLAQASAFCMTAHLLSQPCPTGSSKRLLDFVSWTQTAGEQKVSPRYLKLAYIQHALVNRVVGYFYTHLRFELRHGRPSPHITGHLVPDFRAIPLATMTKLPAPFSRHAVEDFSQSHLSCISDHTFFTGDGLTVYFSVSKGDTLSFNGIGDYNADLVYNNDIGQWRDVFGQLPHGRDFDPIVRFQLVSPYQASHETYTLNSNNFYSGVELHRLTVVVEKRMGKMDIDHWNRAPNGFYISEAVVTPFGLVSGLIPNKFWLWLWKKSWSVVPSEAGV